MNTVPKAVIVRGFQTPSARDNQYLDLAVIHGRATNCQDLRLLHLKDRTRTGFAWLSYYNEQTGRDLGIFQEAVAFLGGSYHKATGIAYDEQGRKLELRRV